MRSRALNTSEEVAVVSSRPAALSFFSGLNSASAKNKENVLLRQSSDIFEKNVLNATFSVS